MNFLVGIQPAEARVSFVADITLVLGRVLMYFQVGLVGAVVTKILITFLALPRGGIHMLRSNMPLQSLCVYA